LTPQTQRPQGFQGVEALQKIIYMLCDIERKIQKKISREMIYI
jgi:hypothetical protein